VTAQTSGTFEPRFALWVLLIGNFIIGTGILLPTGLLNDISADMHISSATAGYLALAGGIVVGIGAPLAAAFTSRIDRRTLLTFALVLYAAGHIAAALAPTFTQQIFIRTLTVFGAAIFTPQAAATAGLLVPPEKRAAAIAFIFIGWSSAAVVGIPLGSYLAPIIGWRTVYAGMGVACLLVALLVWRVLRPGLHVTPLSFSVWKQALTTPVILTVLLVTLLSMSGQFTAFTYIAPVIRKAFGGGPEQVAIAFAVAGVTGVAGNAIASRVVSQLGIDRVIAIAITGLVLGLGLFALSFGAFFLALCGIGLWGLGSFSSNSLQQSRLLALAPPIASATIALNTSVVYLGQAVGALTGGWFVDRGVSAAIGWTACGFALAALCVSIFATRLSARFNGGSGARR
jgi:MFS transporter, DHA1 family, inner membrane transport protein